jgi:hypothetical protein
MDVISAGMDMQANLGVRTSVDGLAGVLNEPYHQRIRTPLEWRIIVIGGCVLVQADVKILKRLCRQYCRWRRGRKG